MTWEELLIACGTQKQLPRVRLQVALDQATSNEGTVTVIKANGRHRGVGVWFPGLSWDTWFHEINTGDNRSRYMDQLELINE